MSLVRTAYVQVRETRLEYFNIPNWKRNLSFNMAYHHDRSSIREAYEERFSPVDAREVTVHRVVNIVEKRNPTSWQGPEYERGYDGDPYYGEPRYQSNARGYYAEDYFQPNDGQYFDENPDYDSFRRNSPPNRNEGSYSQKYYGQDDLRNHLSSRNHSWSRPLPAQINRNRGHPVRKKSRGSGPSRENREDYTTSKSLRITRDRSPSTREAQTPPSSRSNSSNRSFSPDKDKSYTYQQQQKHSTEKTNIVKNQTPSSSAEGSPHSSIPSQEKPPASSVESEEAAAASLEPKPTPEEARNARRCKAINDKVLEIQKHYSQDCETFRTVVKILVDKEPSLEGLLKAPLDKSLLEMKQRCLDSLRSFVAELDEILEPPHNSE
ncbi:periphilin-1 isoform X2 [Austrofundulus limnaeus]|uniref:Periphilin-1 isoform X2 n=1 Tax=Austrofundulus limnaeus TaxID=52670 RepID=A0A2I4C8F9_AUSLI|nr:PREDICTED: periphilin-1 isoform X2 [Austrofundulus limnaeus]